MSRRARGFAVWAVLKALGRQGVAEMVERHCAVARHIAARLAAEPGLAVLNEVVLNQVAFACGDGPEGDALTRATLARGAGGRASAIRAHGRWRGREIIRVSVSAGPTTIADGDAQRRGDRRGLAAGAGARRERAPVDRGARARADVRDRATGRCRR